VKSRVPATSDGRLFDSDRDVALQLAAKNTIQGLGTPNLDDTILAFERVVDSPTPPDSGRAFKVWIEDTNYLN
jgi:hypothetical protein